MKKPVLSPDFTLEDIHKLQWLITMRRKFGQGNNHPQNSVCRYDG